LLNVIPEEGDNDLPIWIEDIMGAPSLIDLIIEEYQMLSNEGHKEEIQM